MTAKAYRVGYDSTNSADLPNGGAIYPAYVDGAYRTYAGTKKRFPKRLVPRITVNGSTPNAEIVDCENGDATPQIAAQWAARKKTAGNIPTIYCNESSWATVKAECKKVGLKPGVDVVFWIAWYTADGSTKIPKGAIGRQWASPDGVGKSVSGGHYDVSAFVEYWPGVDPKPKAVAKGFSAADRRTLVKAKKILTNRANGPELVASAKALVEAVVEAGQKVTR